MHSRGALWLVAGALVAGCGHGSMSDRTSAATAAVASGFEDAYDSVRSGAQQTARSGEYVVERAGEGAVRIYNEAAAKTRVAGRDVTDAGVTAGVKANLARDPLLSSTKIHVTTDAGMVTLKGDVRDRHEAARAVQDALGTSGVYAVDSQLGWPGSSGGDGMTPPPSGAPPSDDNR